jgi:hypothetical protein
VVPAFPIQNLEQHHPVAEEWFQPAIQDLDDVGFGDAAAQLMDELGRRRREDRFLQASGSLEPGGGDWCRWDSRRLGSRMNL